MSAAPPYEPGVWNNEFVCGATNCYAYAANDPYGHLTGGFQMPGLASGEKLVAATPGECIRCAESDGMIFIGDEPASCDGHYLVALRLWQGVDFHWMRQDADGLWSHKTGNGPASRTDHAGQPIIDPRTAFLKYHHEFVGFFLVPEGGIKTAEKLQPKPQPAKGWGEWLLSLAPKMW